MATTRPFAYNTGPSISGTTQLGDLAIGDVPQDYSSGPGGVTWWMGPDEDLGYVIAVPVPDNTQPTNISGVTASVGFYGTETMSNPFDESTFLTLVNNSFSQNFTTGNDASIWLTNSGYWNSWVIVLVTPTQTPTTTLTSTPTQTPTPSITASQTQTPTPSITASQTQTPTPSITASQTQTPTNTVTPTNTTTKTPTPTVTPTNTPNLQGFNYTNFASTAGLTAVGNAAVTSNIYYLTTNTNGQVGNVYRTTAIQYNRNFSAQWEFIIGGGTGADGYCVQWTTTNNTNGITGGGVGRISESSTINAISFTTFPSVQNVTWYKSNVSQGTQAYTSTFRQTLYYWLDYNHATSTASVYISTTSTKPGSAAFTYSSFSFDTTSYYMGFGAATGGSNDNHELVNWKLTFT